MYQLAPEWVKQQYILITWPHPYGGWDERLPQVKKTFLAIIKAIATRQAVIVNCYDANVQEEAEKTFMAAGVNLENIRFVVIPTNDTWIRDYGPLSVFKEGQAYLLDFGFNAWGSKYPYHLDKDYKQQLCSHFADFKRIDCQDFILEGGSIEVNGQGCLLTTSSCLLTDSRNAGWSKAQIEQHLKPLLGIHTIHWLEQGHLAGDDTDGHIDMLARFCDANTICYTACNDVNDEHYAALAAMEQEIKQLKNPQGEAYKCVALPWPNAKYTAKGRRLPASYSNFLIINGAVLVPIYSVASDGQALNVLQACFPNHEIIGIECSVLIENGGSLHCSTMQIPLLSEGSL